MNYMKEMTKEEILQKVRELERQLKLENELWENLAQINDEQAAENEELKKKLEQADRSYDILLRENEALLLRADRLEAENKELKAELDIRQAKAYEYDKLYDKYVELVAENNELKERFENADREIEWLNSSRDSFKFKNARLIDENSKLKAKIEESIECGADCDKCKNKCRAWQNGFNAKGSSKGYELIKAYIDTTSAETDGEVIAHIEGIIEALECDTE